MHQPNNLSLPCYRETCQTVPRGPNSTKCSTYTPIQQKKKKEKKRNTRQRSKEQSRVLINEPIERGSNDEKSVSLPGSERESRRGFRLVATPDHYTESVLSQMVSREI